MRPRPQYWKQPRAGIAHLREAPTNRHISGSRGTRPRISASGRTGEQPERARVPWPVFLFIVSQVIPWVITIGPVRMSVYRIVLIAMIVPCLLKWIRGEAGPIRFADLALLLFSIWCMLSLIAVHGLAFAMQPSAILFIETMGAYLLARCYIRTMNDLRNVTALLFMVVIVLLPFALFETWTAKKPLLAFFSAFFPTPDPALMEPRLGLWRVQGPFEHSILFGTYCGGIIALVHMVLGQDESAPRRWLMTGAVAFTAFLSLSSGAISGMAAQGLLVLWNWLLRDIPQRWKILWGLVLAMYVFIDVASNQTVPAFYISHFSFDKHTAWFRLLIWDYGSASALNHPWFGVGFNEWDRPNWMPPSIDMFWLVPAVRHGIPAGILMILTFFSATLSVGLRKGLDERLTVCRTAYLITMTGFFLVGWTVHYWNATYVLFIFLMGSGLWLLDAGTENNASASSQAGSRTPAGRGDRRHSRDGLGRCRT